MDNRRLTAIVEPELIGKSNYEIAETIISQGINLFNYKYAIDKIEELHSLIAQINSIEEMLMKNEKLDDFYNDDQLDLLKDRIPIVQDSFSAFFSECIIDNSTIKNIQTRSLERGYHPIIIIGEYISKTWLDVSEDETYTLQTAFQSWHNNGDPVFIQQRAYSNVYYISGTDYMATSLGKDKDGVISLKLNIYAALCVLYKTAKDIKVTDFEFYYFWESTINKLNGIVALRNLRMLHYKLEAFARKCKIENYRNRKT